MRAQSTSRLALVVEDEWLVRANIVSELRERGWTAVDTATGEDALALLAVARLTSCLLTFSSRVP